MLDVVISRVYKKWPRNRKSKVLKKLHNWVLISFNFHVLWISRLKKIAGISFAIVVAKTFTFCKFIRILKNS